MSDATSTFTVRARADVSGAVAGLNDVADAVDDVDIRAGSLSIQFSEMAGAIITAELAMAAFQAAVEFSSDSIAKAVELDAALTKETALATQQTDRFRASLGTLILGGDAAQQNIREFGQAMAALSEFTADMTDAFGVGTVAIDAFKYALAAGSNIITGAAIAWTGLVTAVEAGQAVLFTFGDAVTTTAVIVADFVQNSVAFMIDGFAGLIDASVRLADSLGAGGLVPEAARNSGDSLRELADSLTVTTTATERIAGFTQRAAGSLDLLGDSARDNSEWVRGIMTANVDFMDALFGTTAATGDATEATRQNTRARGDNSDAIAQQIAAMNAQDDAWEELILQFNRAGAELRALTENQVKLNSIFDIERAEFDAARLVEIAIEAKGKLAAALSQTETSKGFGFGDLLGKDYNASAEAMTALGGAADGLGGALADGLGAALSTTENFGKAFAAATGQALVSSGIQTLFEGLKSLIPLPGLFNPAAAAVAIPLGGAMIGAGKLLGAAGGGGVPTGGGGGGASAPEQTGLKPVQTTQPDLNLVDYTGMTLGKSVTIVTNDVDSMRTFTDRQARTAQSGVGARV
jgi:hypothetical protein